MFEQLSVPAKTAPAAQAPVAQAPAAQAAQAPAAAAVPADKTEAARPGRAFDARPNPSLELSEPRATILYPTYPPKRRRPWDEQWPRDPRFPPRRGPWGQPPLWPRDPLPRYPRPTPFRPLIVR